MVTATLCICDARGKFLQHTNNWPLAGSTSTFLYDGGQAAWQLGWLSWLPAHVASQYIMIITKIHCFHDSICKGSIHYEPAKRHVAEALSNRLPKHVVRSQQRHCNIHCQGCVCRTIRAAPVLETHDRMSRNQPILPCNEVGNGAVTIANSRFLSWLCPVPGAPNCGRVASGRAFVQI